MDASVTDATEPLSKTRRTWFSALAAFLAVVFGTVLFGWLGLFLGWIDTDMGGSTGSTTSAAPVSAPGCSWPRRS